MTKKKRVTKLFISSILLSFTVMLILINKKQVLVASKTEEQNALKDYRISLNKVDGNNYGLIMSADAHVVDGATVETIALNVPKHRNSSKRIVRYGKLVRYEDAIGTILICHGFMCDKFDVGFLRHMFPQGQFNFMTFDFRAHGECAEGQRCTFGKDEACDVITAGKFLKNHPKLKGKPVLVYGFSMGAVAAIEAQALENTLFSAMVLDCPFDSSENIIKRNLESLQFTFCGFDFSIPACNLLQKYAFHPYVQSLIKGILKTVSNLDTKSVEMRMYPLNPAESAHNITVPVCLIHCKNDEKVPVESIKRVYEGVGSQYKMLWLTNGRRHFDSYFYNPEKYILMVRSFLDHVIDGSIKNEKLNKIIEDTEVSRKPI
jgi:alpha-beta hydrolase superfamily lysophospholipase